jgi:hypothetical protein
MDRWTRCSLCVAIATFALSMQFVLADAEGDFSGNYVFQTGKSKLDTDFTLGVVQNDNAVQVTEIAKGKKTINTFPLDGSTGDYTSPGGVTGKCKGQVKGKELVLENFIVSKPSSESPAVHMHIIERWKLSSDKKTLTIHRDEQFPDFSQIAGAVNRSETEKYSRTE